MKVTHLLYIDKLKIFASSATKLERVTTTVTYGMECIGLRWNEKKCTIPNVKRGSLDSDEGGLKIDNLNRISNLREDTTYKYLHVLENTK